AADDDDVGPDLERLAEVGLFHEIDSGVDAFEIRARVVESHGIYRARGDGHGVEVGLELLEGDVDADRGVVDEPDAQAFDEADVHLDRLAREAEGGNADEHRPAGVGQAVEDRDLLALGGQLAGHGQPGRTGPDD